MNKSINSDYIEYKVLFITSAYYQQINENLIKLFITVNDQIYFPKFIFHGIYSDSPNEVRIGIKRLDAIVCNVLRLTRGKCNEIKS